MTSFYSIEPEGKLIFGYKWAWGELGKPINTGDPEICPVCHKPVSSLQWLPPHNVKLSSYKINKIGDFIWGSGFRFIVSKHVINVFKENNVTGIDKLEMMNFVGKKPENVNLEYYLPIVLWNGANQDDEKSEVVHKNLERLRCSYCRVGYTKRTQKRVIIDISTWNGCDVFHQGEHR